MNTTDTGGVTVEQVADGVQEQAAEHDGETPTAEAPTAEAATAETHRAVFGADATLPGDVLDTVSDSHGSTVADEVGAEGWTWNEADTETQMEELVDIAARLGVWGHHAVGLMIVPDYDEPPYVIVSLALPGRYRLAADAVELRELLGPRPAGSREVRCLAGRELAGAVLTAVTAVAVELVLHARGLRLPVLDPRPAARRAAGAAGVDRTADRIAEGVRGDG